MSATYNSPFLRVDLQFNSAVMALKRCAFSSKMCTDMHGYIMIGCVQSNEKKWIHLWKKFSYIDLKMNVFIWEFETVGEETEKSSLAIRISPYSEKVPLCVNGSW